MAAGDVDRYVEGNKTVELTDGNYEAVLALTKNGNKKSWLLSGWDKIETTGEASEVSATSDPTQNSPTFSREALGAVISDANLRKVFGLTKESGEKNVDNGSNIIAKHSRKKDSDYMKAVESGDTKTAEQMVKDAAKAAMPNTKVVDEEGNPKLLYRGSNLRLRTIRRYMVHRYMRLSNFSCF